jgi:uncharacterized membrane-anchored protein
MALRLREDEAQIVFLAMSATHNKVAQVTSVFWMMKICATTLGETAGDLLSMTMGIGYAASSLMLLTAFGLSLGLQLSLKRFHPAAFWLVIITTSTAGTTISDYMDRTLGLGYAAGSAILAALLSLILAVWFASERSLAVADIRSRRTETYYWFAILVSNTLGTALGDYLADDSGLGFMGGATLIGGAIFCIALIGLFTNANKILLFWLAFVLTRPFGATLGDLMTKAHSKGGLGFGTVITSSILFTILALLVILSTARRQALEPAV